MAENYKELYHWAKYMLDKYQDEIVPGLREQLEKRVEVVRCEDCKWWKQIREDRGRCKQPRFSVDDDELDPVTEPNAFCSYGERREDGI